jgi:hypothetical protein
MAEIRAARSDVSFLDPGAAEFLGDESDVMP